MDFWAENQGHLPQYSKYNTLPSRSCSQNYHDRQPPPQYQAYCEDQRGKTIDSGYYWPPRDTSNWSSQESAAPTSPVQFPFNLDHPIQHYHGDQRQELQDWTPYQHQERGFQQEGWSYNPVHYKREISRKNDNNFRELEAWALRYSHSLPRRRRIEAGLRGAMQDNIERRDMQMTNMQDSTLRDRASRQQVINSYQTMPQRQNLEVKNELSYQTKVYSQPPNYNAPPPYSVQYRSVLTPQKLVKQSYELPQIVNKTEKELNEKFPIKGLDILQENRQMVQRRPSSNAAKVIEGRKFQLNKKAGGLTIFCLVSRIADTEPDSLPVSPKQSEVPSPKASSVCQPLKLADEVDFKIPTTTTKHIRSPFSKLQAIPICKESLSKMAGKNMQKSNDVSVIDKLAAKFPLWRRPSFTSSSDTDNAPTTSPKETLDRNVQDQGKNSKSDVESQREGPKDGDQDNDSKSNVESQRVGTKDGDATPVDTTCVVVKMDLLKAPTKQQVQCLNSENQTKTEENLAGVTTQHNQDIQTEQQDSNNAEAFKTLAEQSKSEDAVEKTKSEPFLPPNSETLKERAKRICGLRESTMIQLQNNLTKQSYETNELKDESSDQKELVLNVSTISKSENLQTLQVSSCKGEEMERSSDIFEVGKSEESITKPDKGFETDNEVQRFKMAKSPEQESVVEAISEQCKEPDEMNDSADISTLELIEQEGDNDILTTLNENCNLKQHLENIAWKLLQSEVEEDKEGLSDNKNDATQTVLTVAKVEHLSENMSDLQDQDVKEVSEESSDLVENVANGKPGELKCPVKIDHEIDTNELEMREVTKDMQELDSGQKEDAPTLEQSENELNQCVKVTETANVELYGGDTAEGKSVLKDGPSCSTESSQNGDEAIEGATRDFKIQEKRVETVNEIHTHTQSEVLDESTKKEQSDVIEQEDISIASSENTKDFEESENEKQFSCRNKVCTNEEECITKKSTEETQLGADEGIKPATLTAPKVEILSDAEQKAGKEEEKVNLTDSKNDGFSVDNAISSNLEMEKTIELNDNTEFDQEKSEICTKDTIISFQNLEADHLEINHKEEVVKDINQFDLQNKEERLEEITGAELNSDTAAIFIEDNKQANEIEMQKDMDLKEQILDEIGKIDASDCDFNDFNLEECEWDDDIVDDNIMKDRLNAKDPHNEICPSTKSEDILQPQGHSSDKDITGSHVVCQPDSNVNTTSTDISEQSHPSASTTDNDNCETACYEEERKYPKSLWDAVNRIRKHTAPDSENEEEEVIDNWDRESLVSVESVCENGVKQGNIDLMQSELWYDDMNMQDETLSQCSNSSQGSDGTIVDDELGVTEMTNVECIEICDEDQSSDGEGHNASENENTINQNQTEESPDEGLDKQAEKSEDIML
ncbi:uncharacterized protein LOC129411014 [Boleophthalmus pectinirostris]|uniref:uncharacterized protein LOC129411014 n=1 Tax=Boleophthalmus pectinirostris TaxID=150288 RepID=UPI002430D7C0|nr:uncharacterized protein LOC129411014 [Boleophthalmus pectinirostris]XP_055016421.1 uncharacterized protein LOC129411014 [Boleophthalmus pectinirostris]